MTNALYAVVNDTASLEILEIVDANGRVNKLQIARAIGVAMLLGAAVHVYKADDLTGAWRAWADNGQDVEFLVTCARCSWLMDEYSVPARWRASDGASGEVLPECPKSFSWEDYPHARREAEVAATSRAVYDALERVFEDVNN